MIIIAATSCAETAIHSSKRQETRVQSGASLTQQCALWQQMCLQEGTSIGHLHPCGCTGFPGNRIHTQYICHSVAMSAACTCALAKRKEHTAHSAQCCINKLGFIIFILEIDFGFSNPVSSRSALKGISFKEPRPFPWNSHGNNYTDRIILFYRLSFCNNTVIRQVILTVF